MRKLVTGLFAVLFVFSFSVHNLSAQASDSAQLNLTGQVPSFGSGSAVWSLTPKATTSAI
ncbi:MAG: hypothetical protein EA383_05865 [Spirochaetaceae bacterium]|nr:MAG: hypothetical protein EA383_05865 [Spirochaetaceae bacterium]